MAAICTYVSRTRIRRKKYSEKLKNFKISINLVSLLNGKVFMEEGTHG